MVFILPAEQNHYVFLHKHLGEYVIEKEGRNWFYVAFNSLGLIATG